MGIEKLILKAVEGAIEGTAFAVVKGKREVETWGLPNGIVVMTVPSEVKVVRYITVEKGTDGSEIQETDGTFITPYGATARFCLIKIGGGKIEWVTIKNFKQDLEHHHKGGARVAAGDWEKNLKRRFHQAESPVLHATFRYLGPEDLKPPKDEAA